MSSRATTERLAATVSEPLTKVMLLTTGAESNEAALRLAKLVTGRHEIASFARSWHGMTQGASNATYVPGRAGYGRVAPGTFALPVPDRFRWSTRSRWAAWPRAWWSRSLSSGGVVELPPGYLAALHDKCRERGMLLIVDVIDQGVESPRARPDRRGRVTAPTGPPPAR